MNTLHRFRKKPVIIHAFQMTKERGCDNSEWPTWLHDAWNRGRETVGAVYRTTPGFDDTISIKTREGELLVSWNDWIIMGVQGELYPCKPNIFALTYEPVEDSPQGAERKD